MAATTFDHYDSRSHDPLHTHAVISDKVRTVQDGKWRTLDGRPMYRAIVAVSEMYNAVLADHLTRSLGLGWESCDRNPTWEITGVPAGLIGEFSTRSKFIEQITGRLRVWWVRSARRGPAGICTSKCRGR